MARCLIALGSNMGDRRATLEGAVERLGQAAGVRVVGWSRWLQTRPVGGPAGQEVFWNGAVVVETTREPEEVLGLLQEVENQWGRRREQRWGPRALDLDLLLYDQWVLETPTLTVPHPRMAWRRFVLEPAAEVAAEMVHPTTGWTIAELLHHLNTAPPYVAITGPPFVGKTGLAARLAQALGGELLAQPAVAQPQATGAGDSSSIAWDLELEFLEVRTRLLAAEEPRWRATGPWISDFWLGQSLSYATANLPTEQRRRFVRHWEAAQRRVVKPKLIVLIDPPHEAIRIQATIPGQGPVLRLKEATSPQAFAEVQAAVEAGR